MKNMMKILSAMVLAIGMLMPGQANAAVSATAGAGVVLPCSAGYGTPMAVTYVPTFNRYYAVGGGNPANTAEVFDAAGTSLGTSVPGVDKRGLYYNPNTGFLETVSFAHTGIYALNLDPYGDYLGTNTLLAGSFPAIGNVQTMPSYDPVADLLYAKQGGTATVNVVNRTTGVAQPSITLDLAAAGVAVADVSGNSIGFTGRVGEDLVIYDSTNSRVLVFDLTGAFVGASVLPTPIAVVANKNTNFGTSYANGQFFVYDGATGVNGSFLGFRVFKSSPDAPTAVTATADNAQATVNFTAPVFDGGSVITTYTATASPGGQTGTCAGPAACPITVTGLTNGTAYTFTVTATNAVGTSTASTASSAVTPTAPPATKSSGGGGGAFNLMLLWLLAFLILPMRRRKLA